MNKTYYIPEIQEYAKEVEVSQSGRFMCPCCGGGSTKEKTLSITRRSTTEASFYCFRAKCNLGGGHIALYSGADGRILKHNSFKGVTNNDIAHNLAGLDKETAEFFISKFHFTPAMLMYGRFQTTFDRRIYMWIFDPNRLKRGGVVRKYKELYTGRREYASIPKSMNHLTNSDDVVMSWYYRGRHRRKNSDTLVIVEDIPSALRLSPYCDSVALLGTTFGDPKQREIRLQGYDRVVIALDEDATAKAMKYKKSTRLYLPQMEVMLLEKDVKDMTPTQLEEKLNDNHIL